MKRQSEQLYQSVLNKCEQDRKQTTTLDRIVSLPWEDDADLRSEAIVKMQPPAIKIKIRPLKESNDDSKEPLAFLRQMFSESALEEIVAVEKNVHEWFEKDPGHVLLLLADPSTSLEKAGVKLSPATLAEIINLRAKALTPEVLAELGGLKQLSLHSKGEDSNERKEA